MQEKRQNDAIWREDAVNALNCDFEVDGKENAQKIVEYINGAYEKIRNLPPAYPVKATWKYNPQYFCYECSNCHMNPTQYTGVTLSYDELKDYRFCRYCGAIMIFRN